MIGLDRGRTILGFALAVAALVGPVSAAASPATEKVCARVAGHEPPQADRPSAAQLRTLKGCDAEALYYGIGRKPDPVRARLCAFAGEGSDADEQVFGGPTILMQVYANGLGVRRDLDVATAYACGVDGAPAEIEGRIEHLQAMRRQSAPKRFDYCDDITSGLNGGFCSQRESQMLAVGRDARLKALAARLPPPAKARYAALKTAFDAFVDAHGFGEVDQSGTGRNTFVIEEQDKTRDRFVADLAKLLGAGWPAAAPAQAAAADRALNAAYRQALAFLATKDNFSTVKPEDVRKAQRAWLVYRDAYVRFAKAAAPRVEAEAVTAMLTRERTKDLTDLAG